MEIQYRQTFLKDLKSLKGSTAYQRIYEVAFTMLPNAASLQEIPNVKAMQGHPNRYRIRIGDYRIGIEVDQNSVEILRALHRREFYRYFP